MVWTLRRQALDSVHAVYPLSIPSGQNMDKPESSEDLLRSLNEQLMLSGLRERAAREAAERANAVREDFLAIMSHELRTPLQAMLGWIVLLRSGKLSPVDAAHALEVIERNVRIQAQLVSDLLDVSRALKGRLGLDLKSTGLHDVVTAAMESLRVEAQARNIRLEGPADGKPVVVNGDAIRLQQVISNLLANAVKFSDIGGIVRVEIEADDARARVRVSDSGEGFDADFAPMMFEPFRQESEASTRVHGGLGLGLMIVRHLIEAHGGTVHAESAGKGRGATFVIELPLATGAVATAIAPASSDDLQSNVLSGLSTLVVDDDQDSRELVSMVLRSSGAEVSEAGSAREALALLSAREISIVVSDLAMPEVDGYGLLRALRQGPAAACKCPVVALSALAAAEDRDRALAAGFSAHAAKPIVPEELIKTVARAAGRLPR